MREVSQILRSHSAITRASSASHVTGTSSVALSIDSRALTVDVESILDVYEDELNSALTTMGLHGAHDLRPHQSSAIARALNNSHVYLSLGTGAGKSLCFQIPAIIQARHHHKVTVVIEPTLEIISSQVRGLAGCTVEVEVFSSTVSVQEKDAVAERICKQGYRPALIYTTADSFFGFYSTVFSTLRDRGALARIVLDEAHTVLSWQDFRPPLVSS